MGLRLAGSAVGVSSSLKPSGAQSKRYFVIWAWFGLSAQQAQGRSPGLTSLGGLRQGEGGLGHLFHLDHFSDLNRPHFQEGIAFRHVDSLFDRARLNDRKPAEWPTFLDPIAA